jgi:hypothetical protein
MSLRVRLSNVDYFVWGPVLLVGAGLLDLFLVTRVFAHPDPVVGVLSFLLFGALTGLPVQIALSRSPLSRSLEGPDSGEPLKGAVRAGMLAATSTAAWLFCLGTADPALAFPLASLSPVLLAVYEGLNRKIAWSRVIGPLAVFFAGLWLFRAPGLEGFSRLTPAVILALCIRNLCGATAEIIEKKAVQGSIARFNVVRFAWLTGIGVPAALAVLVLTSRLDESLALIARAAPVALPLHMMTMVLSFGAFFLRARARQAASLTLCNTAYSTPPFLAPLAALALNGLVAGLFPTVTPSGHRLPGAFLVVAAVVWLAAVRGGQPQPAPALLPSHSLGRHEDV